MFIDIQLLNKNEISIDLRPYFYKIIEANSLPQVIINSEKTAFDKITNCTDISINWLVTGDVEAKVN